MSKKQRGKNFIVRGKCLYIDYQKDKVRQRIGTSLKDSPEAREFISLHYERFLKGFEKEQIQAEFKAFCDTIFEEKALKITQKHAKNALKRQQKELLLLKDKASIISLAKEAINEKRFLKANSQKSFSNAIANLLEFCESVGLESVKELSRKHCFDFVTFLQSKNHKQGTIKNTMCALNAVLKIALEEDIIANNCFFMPKFSSSLKDTLEIKPFSLDEVYLLLENAKDELKSYLCVAFFTGARVGELLALRVQDIDFESKQIHINKTLNPDGSQTPPKTRSSKRSIDMLDIVADALKEHFLRLDLSSNPRIFQSHRRVLERRFHKLLQELHLEKRRLYDTRHSFASIMLSKGEEAMWVGTKMMGHKNLNITFSTYAKYLPNESKQRASFLAQYEPKTTQNLQNTKKKSAREAV